MTKIGFLIPEFPGQTHAFFIREREELKKQGVETQIISTKPPAAGAGAATHEWAKTLAKQTYYLSPLSITDVLLALIEFVMCGPIAWLKCLKHIAGNNDLGIKNRIILVAFMVVGAKLKRYCRDRQLEHIHVHSFANAANVAMFSRLLGGPTYSATLHGPLKDYGPNQKAKWCNAKFAIIITKELDQQVRDTLGKYDLPPTFLAPMGVQVDVFKRTSPYIPCDTISKNVPLRLVSCGRLNYVKAHDDLVRAVSELNKLGLNTELTICGSKDSLSDHSPYFDELNSVISNLNLEDKVHLLGSVSEERVKLELESAHFFCLASLHEPLGVATMEAMSMEVPVIVTRSPGVEEMIENGKDGLLVSPRSPNEFVEAIQTLINSPDKTLALAQNGRQKIATLFHSGVSAKTIADGLSQSLPPVAIK